MKMASMSTCFTLTMTPKSRLLPFTSKSSFNRKPPDSYSFPPFQTLRIFWKLQNSRVLVPVVRATSDVDVISSAVRPGSVVETDKLPSDVRNRAMDAVDSSGGRVTVGDVASKAGLTLAQAQKALQALAADTDGFLEVSDEGDVLYVLPKDYRAKLAAKSLRIKVEPLVDKAKAGAEYLIRVSFGTALIASIVLVFTAIIVALSSTKSNDDNRGRRSKSYDTGLTFYFSPNNLSGYWDPYYHRRQQAETDDENGMNFIESIFSFVFGDGDPNQGIEEKRWKLIGQYIASHGGVVAAEELAPYLDLQSTGGTMSDESYILPVLLRFDGQPELDEEGNILYRFPSLQRTASSKRSGRKEYVGRFTDWVGQVEKVFLEKKWQFSKTNVSERAMVIGLGGLNLFGVIVLGAMLKEPAVTPSGFIKFIANIFPLLQIYAGSFFAIPLIRWLLYSKRNLDIEKRNHAREQYAKALGSPDSSLRLKLLHAREMAQRTVIGRDRIVYSTDRDFIEQDYEAKEWDRKFQKTERAD